MIYKDAKPNQAHIALAKLEKSGKLKAVITQNIDGLHQMAVPKMYWNFTAQFIGILHKMRTFLTWSTSLIPSIYLNAVVAELSNLMSFYMKSP